MLDHARRLIARRSIELLLASSLLAGACAGARATAPTPSHDAAATDVSADCPREPVPTSDARALVDEYCVSCHSPTGSAGEDYDFRGDAAIMARRRGIEAKLRLHVMPPPSAPQPSDAERVTLRCWAKQ